MLNFPGPAASPGFFVHAGFPSNNCCMSIRQFSIRFRRTLCYIKPMFCKRDSVAIFFLLVLWSSPVFGSPPVAQENPDIAYYISADTVSYDAGSSTYTARGNVTITSGDRSLRADAVDFNATTKEAEAWGDVYFSSGKDWLSGNRIKINLEKETGTVHNGTLFIQENHFYIRGETIEKTGKNSYHIDAGRFTTCDGDCPDWEITGRDLNVTIDGYGTVRDLTLRTRSIPILYAPFLVFPAKTKRQTGLLVPRLLYSNRNGFEYDQPLFWAISESSDATFYEHYMARRGLKHGLEYRYVLEPESKGAMMYDFLYDRQIDDGTTGEDISGYHYEGFTSDDEMRLNRKRWWLRMKSDQNLPSGVQGKLDVDLVSDQDYLREFTRGYSAYDANNSYFYKEFGRELDDSSDTIRLNQLSLHRGWNRYSLNADFRWYDAVIIRKNDNPDPTLQRLPHIQFEAAKQRLPFLPLYFSLGSSYNYFWRDYGTKGHRADLHPRLYYPMSLFKYLDFEPSFGIRETLWQVEEYENEKGAKEDRLLSRSLLDIRADLSTEFSRIFDPNTHSIDGIKHTVRPQVVYDYLPVGEQDDYPNFEGINGGIDRIEEKNLITYSITNEFTAKIAESQKSGSKRDLQHEQHPGVSGYRYVDFCRIKFSQSYDIIEARCEKKTGERRPFSDVKGKFELQFSPFLGLDADATWSPYDGEYKSYNAILNLRDKRGNSGSVDYRYTQGSSKSILANLLLKLSERGSLLWETERNLKDGQDIKQVIGVRYQPQCWSLDFTYTHDRTIDSREYFVQISLHGLGKIGF